MEAAVIAVAELYVYPIKGCGGTRLESAEVTPRGLRYDRRWMVVDGAGRFLTQRDLARMALIRPVLEGETLRLRGDGAAGEVTVPAAQAGPRMTVRVWDDTCPAVSDGAEVDAWLTAFLGTEAHLVHMPDDHVRPDGRKLGQVGFADAYPFLMVARESLADLNARLAAGGETPLPMNRFRPSVVVAGCEPYAEDTWAKLEIAGVPFAVVKPCVRCVVTTTDQATSARGQEPLRTLASYRKTAKGTIFAQNAVNLGTGRLAVGDAVRVVERQAPPVFE
ncbi:MAG: MOSC domain-containing protein [Anaerolineales bacterium]|nr:MOSC domain-containing protein [Anaerolineales bacterium]